MRTVWLKGGRPGRGASCVREGCLSSGTHRTPAARPSRYTFRLVDVNEQDDIDLAENFVTMLSLSALS